MNKRDQFYFNIGSQFTDMLKDDKPFEMAKNALGEPYSGFNACHLTAKANAKGYESRWLTQSQIQKEGGEIKAGEKPTKIQAFKFNNGKPEFYAIEVFNASQAQNLPEIKLPEAVNVDQEMKDTYKFITSLNPTAPEGYPVQNAMSEAIDKQTNDLFKNSNASEAHKMMSKEMAKLILADKLEFVPIDTRPENINQNVLKQWDKELKNDPLVFYKASQDSAKLVQNIMKHHPKVQLEQNIKKSLNQLENGKTTVKKAAEVLNKLHHNKNVPEKLKPQINKAITKLNERVSNEIGPQKGQKYIQENVLKKQPAKQPEKTISR